MNVRVLNVRSSSVMSCIVLRKYLLNDTDKSVALENVLNQDETGLAHFMTQMTFHLFNFIF